MNRKVFGTEIAAQSFAKQVNGTVRMRQLPGYMSCEIVWVVEWED